MCGVALESNGIAAERKSIYDDIEALRTFGMDIEECKRGRVFGYYVASRTFELPELKLLVDSVQSSKFITHKKDRVPRSRHWPAYTAPSFCTGRSL